MSLTICLVMFLECLNVGGFISSAQAEENSVDVESYSYEITPIIDPFCYYLYVKTDNPDPTSFRFIDKDSDNRNYDADEDGAGVIRVCTSIFSDVVYEDETTYRVAGGYIFENVHYDSDGGTLTLQKQVDEYEWQDTNITIECTELMEYIRYIYDNYIDESKGFFENMDAAQSALEELSIYPKGVSDRNRPNENSPYPYFAIAHHADLGLISEYDMYESTDGSLLIYAYPYVLDSLGFPGTMRAIGLMLSSDCTFENGKNHSLYDVTYNGETKTYGGQGEGGYLDFFADCMEQIFTFMGDSLDYSTGKELEDFREKYFEFQSASSDEYDYWDEMLYGAEAYENMGVGSWEIVRFEGYYSEGFIYETYFDTNWYTLKNCWIDGRYVGDQYYLQPLANFEDYPTANILLRNQTYTNRAGDTLTGDIYYAYDSESDTWRADGTYWGISIYESYQLEDLPEQFILTREQVEAMEVDHSLPSEGVYFNGKYKPGTPFHIQNVTGLSTEQEEITIYLPGGSAVPDVTVTPSDAYNTRLYLESADETIVSTWNGGVFAESLGTTEVTVTSYDGSYTTSVKVTVKQGPESVELKETLLTIEEGETVQAEVTVLPEDAENKNLIWTIEDPNIATVDENGNVTGIAEGWTKLTVQTEVGDYSDWCYLVITQSIETSEETSKENPKEGSKEDSQDTVELNIEDTVLGTGNQIALTNKKTASGYDWISSDEKHASVDGNGVVTGLKVVTGEGDKPGTVTITATSKEDSSVTESAQVTVLFNDVMSSKAYYYSPVYWAYNNGITTGRRGGQKFDPSATCTRAEIVTFLWRHAGKPEPSAKALKNNPFSDISKDKYYYKAVLWAYENEITTGRRGTSADGTKTFDPNATCTRREIVTFLWRYAGKPEPKSTESKFTDITLDAKGKKPYYYDAVLWAVQEKITTGKKATNYTTFDPLGECTRGMSVTFLYRYDKNVK